MSEETKEVLAEQEVDLDKAHAIQQQLVDAHTEIAELKMHIDWLERSYE